MHELKDAAQRSVALRLQRGEITEHYIYGALAKRSSGKNRQILQRIADEELAHYNFWKKHTGEECKPRTFLLWWYLVLARIFGMTFALKLREHGEEQAQQAYSSFLHLKGMAAILKDEEHHEDAIIKLLEDQRLEYASSIVLGLNDALVELTGVLAGLTLAIHESRLVAIAGLVTGIAAALSMAVSGYFAAKEEHGKSPVTAALYIGVAYIVVVAILITPYFLFSNLYLSLSVTLLLAILVIAAYTFYIATAKSQGFWRRFAEMVVISLAVAAVSFLFGWLLDKWIGVHP